MGITEEDRERDAWLAFASAAIAGHVPRDNEDDENDDADDLYVDDVVEMASKIADNMLQEYKARYGTRRRSDAAASKRGGRGKR